MGARTAAGSITVCHALLKQMPPHAVRIYCLLIHPYLCRIGEAETQIGGGLIEEVIQVAEGELTLVDTMAQSKV